MDATLEENPLLEIELLQNGKDDLYTADGSVNIKGKPVAKRSTGTWKACSFILGTECCDRLAYNGIITNLVNYLTSNLNQTSASAAKSVTTWTGTCHLTPLIGAVLADEYLGRYWTIASFSAIFFIVGTIFIWFLQPFLVPLVIVNSFSSSGMCILTLSATVFTSTGCEASVCASATTTQNVVFFLGLYLVALGTGGTKPCVSTIGADQFDDTDPSERVQMGSFFNWFYFSMDIGSLIASSFIVWVQEYAGWGLGFGIPTLFLGIGIGCFLGGTHFYRFQRPKGSPITKLCQVLVASIRKWRLKVPEDVSLLYESNDEVSVLEEKQKLGHTDGLRFLDKAAIVLDDETHSGRTGYQWKLCPVTQVEELKILVRMFPIWATLIIYCTVYAQMPTMFVEQGDIMDRTIGSFTIPAASLSTLQIITVIMCVPLYDRLLIPFARKFTGEERGFSSLQRMGIGTVNSILAVSAAAVVEMVRLKIAKTEVVPMSILWQIPQYLLMGLADLFAYVGRLEFFYEQCPDSMRSLCAAFSLLETAAGNYVSSFLVTVVTAVTTAGGKVGWLPDDLNEGHLDYYFLLLAGLSILNLIVYVSFARKYKIKEAYKTR